MSRFVGFVCFLGLIACMVPRASAEAEAADRPLVVLVRLEDEAITPVSVRFVERAIDEAEARKAACLVVVLDTPGGLVDSTRGLVRRTLGSEVPVVVYVSPSGARAASAGVFITLAAHVAAMAPATNIGAAHPAQLGGLPIGTPKKADDEKSEDVTGDKVVNDTVAWARSLAELRGRNADWAERAVRESISVTASEAVKERAVDLLADDLDDLLRQIDGRKVALRSGEVTLKTANVQISEIEMWWGEQFLATLANPNIALLLLLFGFYGILFELYTPGWGVAGTLGILCLVLGFFALAVLPINYVGLALIVIALGLFLAEAFVVSYGFLTLGGIACLILGGIMLVDSPVGFQRVSLWVLAPVTLATAAITVFLMGSIINAQRVRALSGSEALVGMQATAMVSFVPEDGHYGGIVRTHGELWKAVSPTPVEAGQTTQVQDRNGLTLVVQSSKGDKS